MSGLFRGNRDESDPAQDDDVKSEQGFPTAGSSGSASRPSAPAAAGKQPVSGAIERDATKGRVLAGRSFTGVDKRKFRYDVIRGRGSALTFSVTRDDRMSAAEAGEMLHAIHVMFGMETQLEDVLLAFDEGMFFCHTVNGASVLNPGRSKFQVVLGLEDGEVEPRTVEVDYAAIRDKLGDDMRRFFRAYADEIVLANQKVLRRYDPSNPIAAEQWGWLMEVAHDRGLMRFPHLAHDSANACTKLSAVERQAVNSSKSIVIAGTPNSADRMKPTSVTHSADKFDSSVGVNY